MNKVDFLERMIQQNMENIQDIFDRLNKVEEVLDALLSNNPTTYQEYEAASLSSQAGKE